MSGPSSVRLGPLDRENESSLSEFAQNELSEQIKKSTKKFNGLIEMRELHTAQRAGDAVNMQMDALRTFSRIDSAAAHDYQQAEIEMRDMSHVFDRDHVSELAAVRTEMEVEELTAFDKLYSASKWSLKKIFAPLISRSKYHAKVIKENAKEINKARHTLVKIKDLNRKGWGEVAKSFQNEEDLGLEFMEKLEATAKELEEHEIEIIKKDLKALSKITNDLEREEAFARMISPSYRFFMASERKLAEIAGEVEGIEALTGMRWASALINAKISNRIGLFIQSMESQFGKQAIGEGSRIISGLMHGFYSGVDFLFSVVAPIAEIGIIGYDAITSHNFTEFATEVFEFFTFGLFSSFEFWKIDEFSDNGSCKIIPGNRFGEDKTFEQIMLQDSTYFVKEIDLFGKLYIELQNLKLSDEHKLAPYKHAKLPLIYKKVPAKYFKKGSKPNPPFLTEEEIENSIDIEKKLDEGILSGSDSLYSSLAASLYKRKKGYVRNLHAFPIYGNTNTWPKLDGVPVIMNTKNHKNSYDPRIVKLLEQWVTTGRYGPAYNTGKTKKIRDRGIEANKRDYLAFKNYSKDRDGLSIIIANWARSTSGRKEIFRVYQPNETNLRMYEASETNLSGEPYFKDIFDNWMPTTPDQMKLLLMGEIDTMEIFIRDHGYLPMYKNVLTSAEYAKSEDMAKFIDRSDPLFKKIFRLIEAGKRKHNELKLKAKLDHDKPRMSTHDLVDIYVAWEKRQRKDRSPWAYITQPHIFPQLLQELEYYTHVLSNDIKSDLFSKYLRRARGVSRPLNMNMYRRMKYMGDFAQLAYSEEANIVPQFYDEVQKTSGGFLEDTVVTSSSHIRSHKWYSHRVKKVEHPVSWDLIDVLGDITVRIFVLNNPRVAILAFKGTSTEKIKGAANWVLDMAFLASGFITIDKRSNSVGAKLEHQVTHENVQVHYGFLRAWLALQKTVLENLNFMTRMYDLEDIYCVGHSLGAAMASIAAVAIPGSIAKKRRPHCYTYACPKIGNSPFINLFHERVSEAVTAYIDGDVITMAPPVLVPTKDLYPDEHKDILSKLINPKGDNPLGSAFAIIGTAMGGNALSRINFPDVSGVFKNGKFSLSGAFNAASSIAKALDTFTAYRPANSYFRLHYHDKGAFNFLESPIDPQSTASTIKSMSMGITNRNLLMEYHKMENILEGLQQVANLHPDIFNVDKTDLPAWYDGGGITPFPPGPGPAPGPTPPKGKVIPENIARILEKPGTKVIGLAHHKRKYRAWSIVDKEDVDETSTIYFPIDGKTFEERYNRSRKRKAKRKKDKTY